MNELALFAGAGGGILAGKLLGWRTVCAVERDPYAASVLLARQNDGLLQSFPIWDDVCTFDGRPWRGVVDVVSGGFPCQDISVAGKGKGIDGERSGLWSQMFRIICEVRPKFVFVENSPMLTVRGLGVVLADLASVGFDAEWGVLGANEVGAPHIRERIWIVAYPDVHGFQGINPIPSSEASTKKEWINIARVVSEVQRGDRMRIPSSWVSGKGHGISCRVDRTKCIGNAQVPQCAAEAFRLLTRGDL